MTVHIDELHSDVVPTGSAPGDPDQAERDEQEWTVRQRWSQTRCRTDWLAQRVCAVDFDD